MNWLQNIAVKIWQLFFPKKEHVDVPADLVGSAGYSFTPTINFLNANWLQYMSVPFRTQVIPGGGDEENCDTRTPVEIIEALLNFSIKNHLFPANIEQFFTNPKNAWLNEQGYIKLSVRYSSARNGTTATGASVQQVMDGFKKYGIVPEAYYPDPAAPFTFDQYYATVPENVCMLGEYTLVLINVLFDVIQNNAWNAPNLALLQEKLMHSPLWFASAIGSVDQNGIEKWRGNKQYIHARALCAVDTSLETLDSYKRNNNFNQKLALDFPLACLLSIQIKII